VSFDDGGRWQPFQQNLPVTPITDARVVGDDLVLSTMGRGFWILYGLQPVRELTRSVTAAERHLFAVRPALRLRQPGSPEEPASRPDRPDYPPPGAVVDYFLASDLEAELSLEILDARGTLVRRFSSEASGEREEPAPEGMRAPGVERLGTPQLERAAGGHRFVWDLRRPGPWHAEADRSGRGGPLVAPGWYSARLSTGDWSAESRFEVRLDPRVAAAGITAEELRVQEQLQIRVAEDLSGARRAAKRLERAQEQLAEGEAGEVLEQIQLELVTAESRYSQPMLIDQLEYLYASLGRADQLPGRDAIMRHAELSRQLEGLLARLDGALPEQGAAGGR
jgi:hypothetical protein